MTCSEKEEEMETEKKKHLKSLLKAADDTFVLGTRRQVHTCAQFRK